MTPQDTKIIQDFPFDQPSTATVTLSKGKGKKGEQFARFCDALKQLAPQVTVKNDSDIGFRGPVMVVGRHKNIAYCALPTNKILPLFLQALDNVQTIRKEGDDEIAEKFKQIDLPAALKLYVADQCPHCPQTIRQMQNIAAVSPAVRLNIINAELFPQQAQSDQIRSVPTLILEDQFRWIGQVDTGELLKICTNRDPSNLSADSLRQLVENGEAARLATMMKQSDQIFPALIDLLIHHRWSVRLGAMVVVEYLADGAPKLALSLCRLLWDRFSELSPQIQGDVTHLFGLVDTDDTRKKLHDIGVGDYDEDVKAAAAEVLAEMGE